MRGPAARNDPQQHFGVPELGVAGSHTEVGGKSQFKAAPQRVAVDCTDGDLRQRLDAERDVVELLGEGECLVAVEGWEPFYVGARCEVTGSSRQHHGSALAVVGQRVAHGTEFVEHCFVYSVHLGSVEPDCGDPGGGVAFKLDYG